MLMSDSHYCRAVTTSTPRTHLSPYTGRTSRQTRRPHCGGGPFYFQHGELRWIEVGEADRIAQERKWGEEAKLGGEKVMSPMYRREAV
ncbi:hypothetical protein PoB_002065300 [Plakobranchus ocellatus]|uniref:Uncharacterized protein n=1 Tax=Plakobranchus ocellatus TaxID=259542 RepID=A0AAV3ZI48_9GAST|nr:hypothetical protein PoB_002065300 [Plakobranchus ocellatus]